MHKLLAVCLALAAPMAFGQMTRDQKLLDFQQLAALYAKQYAPYEWKRDTIRFDLLKLGPWLERVNKSKDDIEFLEICAEYVTSLQDAHSQFSIPSNFIADSGMLIDMYEGTVVIDEINRNALPESIFPVEVGDELLAVDGKTPQEWIRELMPFVAAGNPRARMRLALDLIVFRPQSIYPRAHLTPDRSRFLVKRRSGLTEAFDLRWFKRGEPLTKIGPVPIAQSTVRETAEPDQEPVETEMVRPPMRYLRELTRSRADSVIAIKGFPSVQPPYSMPPGFTQRLGRGRDILFSGIYTSAGVRIGLLRIPIMFEGFTGNAILNQLVTELNFMQRNTDGLIVDLIRNPGGDVCFTQDLVSLLMPESFQMPGFEIRATREWINRFETLIFSLEANGAAKWVTDILKAMLGDIRGAYSENRGRTGPLPVCDISLTVEPARDTRGNNLAYTKPIMVMVDDLSASAAELLAAVVQDNDRGIVFGTPTLGAGGSVSAPYPVGWYSETSASVTQSLLVRPRQIATKDYPTAPYIENIGVRPDVEGDLMTMDNLRNGGRKFVQAFTDAMVQHVRGSRATAAGQ